MSAPARVPSDWPHRGSSRSVIAGGLDWHVQVAGRGPVLLLLHGSGASAHSWADLLPALSVRATVVAPDLPGHGFTTGADLADLTLPRMAAALAALMGALALPAPVIVVGHSAGAALALRWALQAGDAPPSGGVIGFNPSLVAPPAFYTQLMAPLVNPLATSRLVAQLLAGVASASGTIDRLLDSTQSVLPPGQRACYRTLFRQPEHVRGAMGFMAAADLPALLREGTGLRCPLSFVLGTRETWVPEHALRPVLQRAFPSATLHRWRGGHLLHEEQPTEAAALVLAALTEAAGRSDRTHD